MQRSKTPSLVVSSLALVVGGILPEPTRAQACSQPDKRPNILLIHCDQQRYDCLGYTGNPIVRTPNIDRLASQGMQFSRAYTPIPTSCPARQSLLSGLWPEQHGGLWNYDITLPVSAFEAPTWTEALRASGYRMGYVGKWHVHKTKTPLDFGFDDYVDNGQYNAFRRAGKPAGRVVNIPDNRMMGGYETIDRERTATHWYVRQALRLIREYEEDGKPWHVRLDHVEPHLPCFPTREFYDMYESRSIPPWPNFDEDFENKPYIQRQQICNWGLENYTWTEWELYMRSYYAMITQLDDAIGVLLGELESEGLLENTVVIYTTDHGDAAGSHRMLDKHYVMYEEVVHVPMIVRWDGVVEPGSRCDKFVIHELDLAATLSAIGGVDFPCSGESLLPLLRNEQPEEWRQYACSNYNGQQFGLFVQRMIRDERYKYVWTPTDTDELYDLELDPWETTNRIGDTAYGEVAERLRKALYEEMQVRKDPAASNASGARRQLLENKKLQIGLLRY